MPAQTTVTIRAARPGDAAALVRSTVGNAWETEGLKLDEAIAKRAVAKLLADPAKGLAFVAEEDGKVIASHYVTFEWSDWHDAWYWWVQSLYVVPERRGQGVYTRLYNALKEEARKRGDVRAIRLYVEKENEVGIRAYRGHGMTESPYLVFEDLVR